jgi:hypothetical protein
MIGVLSCCHWKDDQFTKTLFCQDTRLKTDSNDKAEALSNENSLRKWKSLVWTNERRFSADLKS